MELFRNGAINPTESSAGLSKLQIFYFSFLALPLAFVGIPIYLNISDFYARKFDIDLVTIGVLLVFIRIIDALQDPFIGYFSDSLSQKKFCHKRIIYFSSIALCLAFFLVFNPPDFLSKNLSILWFVCTLLATYTFFNFTVINFESLAAIMARNDHQRILLNSFKELFGMLGMILAFLLPAIFIYALRISYDDVYRDLSLVFVGLILLAVFGFFRKVRIEENKIIHVAKVRFLEILCDKNFLAFLGIFFLNGLAVSLPASNLNFYVRDVLQAEKNLGWFLSIYFISACCFIPLWKYLASRFGIIRSWIFSISGSVLTFSFAYFLTAETANYFFLVCLLSGAFLGADLIMPPTLLAKIVSDKKELASSYFSYWNLVTKLSLMIAASSSLIFLGLAGYKPGSIPISGFENAISFFYALLPCILKVLTIFSLIYVAKKLPIYET